MLGIGLGPWNQPVWFKKSLRPKGQKRNEKKTLASFGDVRSKGYRMALQRRKYSPGERTVFCILNLFELLDLLDRKQKAVEEVQCRPACGVLADRRKDQPIPFQSSLLFYCCPRFFCLSWHWMRVFLNAFTRHDSAELCPHGEFIGNHNELYHTLTVKLWNTKFQSEGLVFKLSSRTVPLWLLTSA